MATSVFVQVVGLIIIVYICVYGIVNRICKSAENCAAFKAFGPTAIKNPELFKEAMAQAQKK